MAIITDRSIRFCRGLSILQATSVLRLLRFFFLERIRQIPVQFRLIGAEPIGSQRQAVSFRHSPPIQVFPFSCFILLFLFLFYYIPGQAKRLFFAYGGAFGKVPGESRISIFYFMAFLTDLNHSPHTKGEVIFMSKTKKTHPESEHGKHTAFPASIINGNAKPKKDEANPLIPGAMGKVYHGMPHNGVKIPGAFPAIDNDLAVENMANDFDMTAADLQELP